MLYQYNVLSLKSMFGIVCHLGGEEIYKVGSCLTYKCKTMLKMSKHSSLLCSIVGEGGKSFYRIGL